MWYFLPDKCAFSVVADSISLAPFGGLDRLEYLKARYQFAEKAVKEQSKSEALSINITSVFGTSLHRWLFFLEKSLNIKWLF